MGVISRSDFTTGDIPTDTLWNSNFNNIYNELNGSINAANLADNAVTGVKITNGAVSADKLGNTPNIIAFAVPYVFESTNIRQVMFPFSGVLTKVVAKSAKTPSPQNLVINLTDDDVTLLNASALSMTGTNAVTLDGGSLVNTSIAANSLLELDIVQIGTAIGGGEPLTVNLYIDVAGTEL